MKDAVEPPALLLEEERSATPLLAVPELAPEPESEPEAEPVPTTCAAAFW